MNTDYKKIIGWGFVALVLAFGLILSSPLDITFSSMPFFNFNFAEILRSFIEFSSIAFAL